jgi:hypothetical protein
MAGIQGEESYSDDDLDELAADDFEELQWAALQAAQHAAADGKRYTHFHSIKINWAAGLMCILRGHARPTEKYQSHPSSDYGDLDEEVFDLASQQPIGAQANSIANKTAARGPAQQEQWRQDRYPDPYAQRTGYQERQATRLAQSPVALAHRQVAHPAESGDFTKREILDDAVVDAAAPPPPAADDTQKRIAEVSLDSYELSCRWRR